MTLILMSCTGIGMVLHKILDKTLSSRHNWIKSIEGFAKKKTKKNWNCKTFITKLLYKKSESVTFWVGNGYPGVRTLGHLIMTLDHWPLTTDPWLTSEPWPLTSDQWPLTLDLWPMTPDQWPPAVTPDHDPWPLTLTTDLWVLTRDPWPVTMTPDLWPWPLITDPWPLISDLLPLTIDPWPVILDHWPLITEHRPLTSDFFNYDYFNLNTLSVSGKKTVLRHVQPD